MRVIQIRKEEVERGGEREREKEYGEEVRGRASGGK